MHTIKSIKKTELVEEISQINNAEEVYLRTRPTLWMAVALKTKLPGLKRVTCPPSLYKQTSQKVFKALEQGDSAIKLEPHGVRVGRPNKHPTQLVNDIILAWQSGKPAKLISADLSVPLRTVYFYINKAGQPGPAPNPPAPENPPQVHQNLNTL